MKINKSISLERQAKIWELRQRSWTQERIAQEVGLSQKTVSKILYRINKRYAQRHEEYVEQVKTEQVFQLEHVADEAMQAWERSKKQSRSLKQKEGGFRTETIKELTDQDGDPRYLMAAMKAKEDIRKIVGADAPMKLESTNKNGKSTDGYETAQARLLARLFAEARNAESGSNPVNDDGRADSEATE